jgi:hypothetical protein
MRLKHGALTMLLVIGLAQGGAAQPSGPRTLEVPATAAWQHAASQMILPRSIAGLARSDVKDFGTGELDVVGTYQHPTDGITASVYIYRTMTADAALWFDRALAAIMMRPAFTSSGAAAPVPAVFTRPGASTASGLRAALEFNSAETRGTAVAIAPIGPWLVKIRLSAARLDRAGVDALMTRLIQDLRWPAESAAERAAVPIEPCPDPLRFRQARVMRSDTANVLMDLMVGVVAAQAEERSPPPVYCREPGPLADYGVYRPNRSTNSYLVALGDAGLALTVGPAMDIAELSGGGGRGSRYSMMMQDRESTSALPSFNRLPPPAQAVSVAMGGGPRMSVSTGDPPAR